MKKRRILKITLITLGLLLLILILDVLFWLGPTVKLLVEFIGPKALGTPVTIEYLSINPRKGTVLMNGFAIANPDTFGSSNAVSIARLDIAVDMGSLFSNTVTVHRVHIDSPHLVYEQSTGSDNIAEFIQSILDFSGYDPEAPPKEKKKNEKKEVTEKEPRITLVESLQLSDVLLNLAHTDDPDLDLNVGFERLSVSMTNGTAQLRGVYIDNPNRLASHALFTLDSIDVLIEPASIHVPPLTILDLQIREPHAFAEWGTDASSVSEFLAITESTVDHISSWPLPEPREPADQPVPEEEREPMPPPELRKASIRDVRMHLVNSADPLLTVKAGIDHVEVDLTEGAIGIGRISITNPKRLTTPDLFSLDGIDIRLDPATLYTPTLSILDVQVRKPHVYLEHNPDTDTVSEFISIANTIAGSLPANRTPATKASPEIEVPQPVPIEAPLELHNLVIDDIQLRLLDTTPTNPPVEPIMIAGVREISVSLERGLVSVDNITVPNPDGFHATNLFHLGNISIEIDPGSVFTDQTVINQVFIDAPEINIEQNEQTGNFAELQKSLLVFVPPSTEAPAREPDEVETPAPTNAPVRLADRPVILEELIVTNLTVNAILPPPPTPTNAMTRGGAELRALNPMSYLSQSDTNTAETVEAEEIELVAFDLLKIEPLLGTVHILNLRVGNPHGFANKRLVQLDSFDLRIDPDSMMTDILLINEILIEKPHVAYERKLTTDNIKTFGETIAGATARREETMEKSEEEYDVETTSDQKVIIERLLVQGGVVKAKISALPTAPIPLPNIEMNDIGKEEGGASLGEASTKIFTAFYDAIIGVVANTTGIAGDALKGAGALTFDALGNLTGGLGELVGIESGTKEPKAEADKPRKKKRHLFRGRAHN